MNYKLKELREERKNIRKLLQKSSGSRASTEDKRNYKLCKHTNRSRSELVCLIAKHSGEYRTFLEEIGYSRKVYPYLFRIDNHYWKMICLWFKYFFNEYEKEFRLFMDELKTVKNPKEMLETASKVFRVPAETLEYLFNQPEELDLFLSSNRSVLANFAEIKLYEQVDKGVPSMLKFVLETLKPDIFGKKEDKNNDEDKRFTINMREKEIE